VFAPQDNSGMDMLASFVQMEKHGASILNLVSAQSQLLGMELLVSAALEEKYTAMLQINANAQAVKFGTDMFVL
jgi:hypothetical protein